MITEPDTPVHILIVEDSATQLMKLQMLLEQEGYLVETAVNGVNALSCIRMNPPLLVISDIVMPEMDGFELCTHIKSDAALKHIAVILLTTLSEPHDLIQGLISGADSFVAKPYTDEFILMRMQYVLSQCGKSPAGPVDDDATIELDGRRYQVPAGRRQMFQFLISAYENARYNESNLSAVNAHLRKVQEELTTTTQGLLTLSRELEQRVEQRTSEVREINESLRREIAIRKEAETQLMELNSELQRSNQELAQFAFVASHDLQEPLRMVASYTQLLARRYKGRLDQDADDFIAFAVEGAQRMQRLLNDLLAYSRVGTRGKSFDTTDCNAVVEQAMQNLQIAISESSAVITRDPLPAIAADEGQMIQLYQNLISNAIKFRNDTPPVIHIGVEHVENDDRFYVRDNGIGIDPRHQERIFLIFQRLNSRDEYPGSGIGLSICKRIVERHKGRIWVESQPGNGAVFYFTIPVALSAEE